MTRSLSAFLAAASLLAASCTLVSGLGDFTFGDGGTDGDGDVDGGGDADADTDPDATAQAPVDILFVVDSSSGMAGKQRRLIDAARPMLRGLVAPSGGQPAVTDLHVGVISADIGSGGESLNTCEDDPLLGDNGQLHDRGRGDGCPTVVRSADCQRSSCPWTSHSAEHPDDGSEPDNDPPLWEDFACIARLGTTGCGFEQPLESSLRALTTQATSGGTNLGFLRDRSLLVLVFLTDEDDCSAADNHMFNPDPADPAPFNTRCAMVDALLYSVGRYVDELRRLRDDGDLIVAAVAGIPADGSWEPGDPIEELEARQRVDPENPLQLLPICNNEEGELAYPSVRMAELVQAFGDDGLIASVCQDDYQAFAEALLGLIRARMMR